MAAEAFNRSGLSDVKARGYLNQVRSALEILIMTFQHQEALTDFILTERKNRASW
jgi:hypothetical protein